jgi:cobalt-zinc-cadmium efflux system membrane fusion protein
MGAAVALFVAAACSKPAPPAEKQESHEHEENHEEAHEHGAIPKSVKLSRDVIAAAKITTQPAKRERLAATLSLPGEIAANPDKSARLATPVSGRIERVEVQEGDRVEKGKPLIVIRVVEMAKVRAERSTAAAKAKAARAKAKRARALFEQKVATENDALDAEGEAESLEAEVKGLDTQLAAMGGGGGTSITLRAPVAGVLVSRNAVVGQSVGPEDTLGSIADLAKLWFLGRVFEKDLGRLHVGSSAEIELNAFPKERFSGKVEQIGSQVDPVARTLTARVTLENDRSLLRIGLFGTARIAIDDAEKREPVLVVPRSAVAEIGGKSIVFVRHEDHYELHEVVLGEAALGKVQVLSGLGEGEPVVVEGVVTLKSVALKETFGEGHHH